MKKIFALLLVLTLGLALVACGKTPTSAPSDSVKEAEEAFAAQRKRVSDAKNLMQQMKTAFEKTTTYRRTLKGKELQLDFTFSGIGTENFSYEGKSTSKQGETLYYGADGTAYQLRGDVLYWNRDETDGAWGNPLSIGSDTSSELPFLLLDFRNAEQFLTEKATISERDGLRTLHIPLNREQANRIYSNMSLVPDEALDAAAECYIEYTVNANDLPISIVLRRKFQGDYEASDYKANVDSTVEYLFSYENLSVTAPDWVNPEDPFQGKKIGGATYRAANGICVSHTSLSWITFPRNYKAVGAELPAEFPFGAAKRWQTNGEGKTVDRYLILNEFPDVLIYDGPSFYDSVVFYVKNTPRPEGNTMTNIYFQGEWSMVDGLPKAN